MIFQAEYLDLQVSVAPTARADPIPIAVPEPPESDVLFFNTEPTRLGRRRRCRDMSGLSLCLCGDSAQPDGVGSIRCHKAGCETVWVSKCLDFVSSRLNLNRLSTIFSALTMRIYGLRIGHARHAHPQRRHGGSNITSIVNS